MDVKVVVPPPEQKAIIDKLVQKVVAQGDKADQFIALILKNDPNNPKFSFLQN